MCSVPPRRITSASSPHLPSRAVTASAAVDLVNARTDVLRERKRRRNREVLFCDLRRSELESLADWQDVPERETVFDAAGKPIGVTDKDLADALEKLCPEEQAIILLSYFAGWSDRRIGER